MSHTKNRRFGITLRIAVLAWLITFATLSIFVTAIIPEQKRNFVENLESKANSVAVSIRDVASGAAVNEDYSDVVLHCMEILNGDKSIDYLVITKNNGQSLINERSGWQTNQLPQEWYPGPPRVPTSGIGIVPVFNRRVFHYSEPFDYSGIQWGWIHVGLSLDAYDRSVAGVYRRTGFLALVCIVLSLLASALYARFLVRPILALQSVVERVARGDLTARAAVHSGDEIELLSDSFNAMTGSLLQRDKILGSVRFAAQQFLAAADWGTAVEDVLSRIGQATEISRVSVFENHTSPDGGLLASERFGYRSSREEMKSQKLAWDAAGSSAWAEHLRQGRFVSGIVRGMSPAEQALLAPQGIQSFVLVPIQIEGAWWGHLGFDDCARERVWTDAELDSLRALADMMGAAIAKQRAQDGLIEAKQTLEQRVTERTRELQEQVVAKEKARAQLAEAQQELIVASRAAGMAEVATGVLHNVGNVLNSVNVSTTLIREKLNRSEVATLVKVGGLLREHEANLAEFLTADPKGKVVPGFIIHLADRLDQEQAALRAEHDQLARNVEHIKEIVAMQQNYARVSGFLEQVSISSLLDDALQINLAGLERHGVKIVRDYLEVPLLMVDKHKVLQILVNLVHNAKYALDGSSSQDKWLKVGVSLTSERRVRVAVADNGVGIPPENLTRVFSHGFTTRKGGHGFGLHSGANAAKEMGGQLTAHSAGAGKGATFTLELPLDYRRNS